MFEGIRLAAAYVSIQPKIDTSGLASEASRVGAQFGQQMQQQLKKSTHLGGVKSSAFTGLTAQVAGLRTEMGKTSQAHASLMRQMVQGTARVVKPMVKGMSDVSGGIQHLGRQVGLTAFQFGVAGTTLTTFVTGPLAAATYGMAKFGLTTAMHLEDSAVLLKALLPPGYKVEALMTRLVNKAKKSPVFGPEDAIKFVQQIVGSGEKVQKAEKVFGAVDKIFTAYGVHGENAQKAILGVTQVIRKGTAYSEELTQQIGEQIPIWHLLSKAMGIPQATLMQMVHDKQITASMFEDMLVKISQFPEVSRAAAAGIKTLSGQWEQFKETVKVALATGLLAHFPEIKKALRDLEPVIMEVVSFFVAHLADVLNKITAIVTKLREWKTVWDGWAPDKKKNILSTIGVLAAAGPILTILGAMGSVINGIIAGVAILFDPVGLLIGGLILAGVGMLVLYQRSKVFRDLVNSFVGAFKAGWDKYVRPAFGALAAEVNTKLIPALQNMAKALGFKDLKAFGTWLGSTLVHALAVLIQYWTFLIDVLVIWIRYITGVIRFFKDLYRWIHNLIKAVSDFRLSSLVNMKLLQAVWISTWATIRNYVTGAFSSMVGSIKSKWTQLKAIVKGPISFFVNTVYDKGIVPVWNAVAGKFGGKALGAIHMAQGGPVPGRPGTGDWQPIYATPGEVVLSLPQVAALGGHKGVASILDFAGAKHYADGGIVGGIARALGGIGTKLLPGLFLKLLNPAINGVRKMIGGSELGGTTPWRKAARNMPSKILEGLLSVIRGNDVAESAGMWGGGGIPGILKFLQAQDGKPYIWASAGPRGYDCSGLVSAVWNLVHGRNPYQHTFSTANEANYFKDPPGGLFTVGWAGPGEKGGGSVGHTAGVFNGVPFEAGGSHGNVSVGHKNVTPLSAFAHRASMSGAVQLLKAHALANEPGFSGSHMGLIGRAEMVANIPASWGPWMATLIGRESGWNPAALSSAGALGLTQLLPATFRQYHVSGTSNNILDPLANIAASFRYIKARYGTIFRVQQANASLPPKWYDNGGPLPPGLNLVQNSSGKTEQVLNSAQSAALESRIRGNGGNGDTYVIQIGDEVIATIIDGRIELAANNMATIALAGRK